MRNRYGLLLGTILGFYLAHVAVAVKILPATYDLTNIVIAVSTIIMAYIAYSAVQATLYNRVWDAWRRELFDLLRCLSDSIEFLQQFIYAYYSKSDNSKPDKNGHEVEFPGVDPERNKRLEKALKDAEVVFSPIFPDGVKSAIKKYREAERRIDQDFDDGVVNSVEAHEELLEASRELQTDLHKFVADFSGVKFLSRRFFRS